jgi:putative ABC transport system permease protein
MDAEMRHHVECETNERIAGGMSPDEARRTALRDFGGIERFKEDARDARGFRPLDELLQDARHSLRVLRRNPAYTAAAVLTFALGIGLSTSIFSVVHGVLLRPLPYANPDRLAVIWERHAARGAEHNVASVPNFEAWRQRSRSFSGMVLLVPSPVTLSGQNPESVMGADVSPGYFHLLGVLPALGRDFTDADAIPGPARVVVLRDGLLRLRFSAQPSIVVPAISHDEKSFTVIGVAPRDFDAPRFGWLGSQQLWTPFGPTPSNRSWGRFLLVVGRLRDGVSLESANKELAAIAEQRAREDKNNDGWSASVVGLTEQITGDVHTPLLILLGAVGLLLIMAATNVASLMLGFVRRREHELAVRRAIGADTGRIVRELLTHSAVLGAIGAVVGLAAALVGTKVLSSLIPSDVPRASSIRIDGAVLAFTTCVGLLATMAFGLVAALRGVAGGASAPAAVRMQTGRATMRMGSGALVVAEIALGLTLTVLAGLMVRSFVNLRGVNLGFDATSVVGARLSLPGSSYDTPERQRAFFETLGERVRAIPGVQAVSFATTRPFACCAPATIVSNPAAPSGRTAELPTADVRYVDSSFFAALRIPIVAGVGFTNHERADGPSRVVVNQSMARALWPTASPIGRQVRVEMYNGLTAEVIGVSGDVHLTDARTEPRATVYLSATRYPSTVRDMIVRGDVRPEMLIPTLRQAVTSVDARLPLGLVTTLSASVQDSLARDRFTTTILTVFAIVSLLLASIGIYGVFSGDVAARRKEIGIRLALGSRPSGVIGLVLRRALVLAMVGSMCGIVTGLIAARSMSLLVFGVGTADPMSFVTVTVALLGVAMLATLIPALRAARVSPLDAIRND